MNAEQIITLADALRSYARQSGRDVNASNLFVHTMLMHALNRRDGEQRPLPPHPPEPSLQDARGF